MNQKLTSRTPLTTKLGTVIAIAALGFSMLGLGQADSTSAASPKATIGQQAPDFTLTDLQGNEHTLSEYTAKGQTVVLEWFSPVCPFVKKHYRADTGTMLAIQKDHKDDSIVWLRINSAREGHRAADLSLNKTTAEKWGITTPILFDPTGTVGKAYGAKTTPEMYIINPAGVLVYHGAIDNRSDVQAPGDVNYVADGLSQLLANDEIAIPTTKSYGCSIKY